MGEVAVLMPTLRRPESLARALRSLFAQEDAAQLIGAIVVVDNSPEGSAAPVVDALTSASPVPLIYAHEPHPGVATARNTGLALIHAPYVAFLDDDEEAPTTWLKSLLSVHKCGNSLMTRKGALDGPQPFDPAYDQVGGEDDRLYQALDRRGAVFAWAAEAWVYEHAPDHRCRVSYALRRAFSFGQTPTTDAAHVRDWAGVVRWMAIGARKLLGLKEE
ncbi:MAG: hypothetical protein B7Y99_11560 [Caulobacterales bacterium 32-69-10]|nr:MAG: hypothetical protein B7Y99_11560 [Caulobacterales bacterium 32-69-10]